ncbi:MAG: hypothetical protein K0M70_12315 [Arenimonas sp.]|uniref:hypothetical protein n=1 Tax=Arenimonas sp. TaxID=1872635 RepID=UPI0025BC07FA|nr:hypothetical protein [Arenimonas sp.]MBW8368626.1 hypothetical protein [Arenimonas sp.]
MKPRLAIALSFLILASPAILACDSDADCANDEICNDEGMCVPDGKPDIQEFLKNNETLEGSVILTEEFKSGDAADKDLCGLRWVRDEGGISVWRAQRATNVWVNETAAYGGVTRILVSLAAGNLLRLKIGRQGLTCA